MIKTEEDYVTVLVDLLPEGERWLFVREIALCFFLLIICDGSLVFFPHFEHTFFHCSPCHKTCLKGSAQRSTEFLEFNFWLHHAKLVTHSNNFCFVLLLQGDGGGRRSPRPPGPQSSCRLRRCRFQYRFRHLLTKHVKAEHNLLPTSTLHFYYYFYTRGRHSKFRVLKSLSLKPGNI